jgi:tetratricopeptide (TPR) repeat protein
MALLFHQDYQGALSQAERSPGEEIWKALALLYLGKEQQSESLIKELLQRESESKQKAVLSVWDASFIHSSYAVLLAKGGNVAGAEEQIRRTIEKDRGLGHFHHSEYNIASAYALMGRTALAMEWLQKTADHGFSCYPYFAGDPHLKNLHSDAAFETFLKAMRQQMNDYRAKFFP